MANEIILRVNNLSKEYQIGGRQEPYRTLRDTLTAAVTAPFQRVGRLLRGESGGASGLTQSFWALNNLSFDVRRGEVVGIIGRNGAGKSTLLKILSRITEPTTGTAEIYGRVGALLEVGTGFHPELTGRDNIYLNGAILGMGRAEIERKFDEIVAFAEVEQFIDTPVKHYSSGMYLRLAFAVAANLEPEILIVDEVLAVGDAAFQKKCLGKMSEVANQGRTVLFVSHNMQAITQLTQRCIILAHGERQFDGPTPEAVHHYLTTQIQHPSRPAYYEGIARSDRSHIAWAQVHSSSAIGLHRWGQPISFEFALQVTEPREGMCFSFQIVNELQQAICHFWLFDSQPYRYRAGRFMLRCTVPILHLYMGSYTLTTYLSDRRGDTMIESLASICPFEVTMQGIQRAEYDWTPNTAMYLEDQVWAPVEETSTTQANPTPDYL